MYYLCIIQLDNNSLLTFTTMTRSEIFTLAHSIAKNTKANFSSYRLAFATALTIAYSQSKQVTIMSNVSEIRYWTNDEGSKRLYVTDKSGKQYVYYVQKSKKDIFYKNESDISEDLLAEAKQIIKDKKGVAFASVYKNEIENTQITKSKFNSMNEDVYADYLYKKGLGA